METTKNIKNLTFFDPAQVAAGFGARFMSEENCRAWVLKKLHPGGCFCPHCKTALAGASVKRFWQNESARCYSCGKQFTAKTGTILSGKNLSFSEIILMSFLIAYGAGNNEISKALNCTRETVRLWRRNFEAWGNQKGVI